MNRSIQLLICLVIVTLIGSVTCQQSNKPKSKKPTAKAAVESAPAAAVSFFPLFLSSNHT